MSRRRWMSQAADCDWIVRMQTELRENLRKNLVQESLSYKNTEDSNVCGNDITLMDHPISRLLNLVHFFPKSLDRACPLEGPQLKTAVLGQNLCQQLLESIHSSVVRC